MAYWVFVTGTEWASHSPVEYGPYQTIEEAEESINLGTGTLAGNPGVYSPDGYIAAEIHNGRNTGNRVRESRAGRWKRG